MEIEKSLKHISPEWGLVSVCFLWGSSFILIATALESISPGLLVTSRFILGALLTALIMGKELKNITRVDWMGGLWAGTCIFFGYFLQTVGLQTIPSSISAFLTALYVPFVPLLQLILFRKVPELTVGLGIAVAFGGMLLILDPTKLSFSGSFGEWLTIASALACALEIIVIGKFATQCNPKAFCLTQLTVVAAWSTAYTIAFEDIYVNWNPTLIVCIAILAGMIAFNQIVINWAQKTVSPTKAVLIYTLEPVFAGIIGWLVGEKIGLMAAFGGVLVVASVIISSWLPRYIQEKKLACKKE